VSRPRRPLHPEAGAAFGPGVRRAPLRLLWPGWLRRVPLRRWRAVGAAACGLGLAAVLVLGLPRLWQAVRAHPYFALTAIDVSGNERLSRREVLQWAGVHEGSSIWDAAPSVLRVRLQRQPWIRHVSVRREFPHRLTISLEERRPVAIVRLDSLEYVGRGGRVLDPLQPEDSRDFPLITGLEGAAAADFVPIGVHRALQLLRLCAHAGFEVSEIHVDRRRGVTVFPLRTAVAVVLGWGNWRHKLARSARVLAAWNGQVERLAVVDATFRNQVVVRLRAQRHPTAVRAFQKGLRV
jgi:cell division protein FtsQ